MNLVTRIDRRGLYRSAAILFFFNKVIYHVNKQNNYKWSTLSSSFFRQKNKQEDDGGR